MLGSHIFTFQHIEVPGVGRYVGGIDFELAPDSALVSVGIGFPVKSWVMTDVPIEHHPTIRYMVYNGYYKVMSNIPKMGQLPTPGS